MAEKSKPPAPQGAGQQPPRSGPPGHRHEHPERVSEEGQDVQNDLRPRPENLSGTPLGGDPRE